MRHSFRTLQQQIRQALSDAMPSPDEDAIANLLSFVSAYSAFRSHELLAASSSPLAAAAPRLPVILLGDEGRCRQIFSSIAAALGLPYLCVFAGDYVANGYTGLHVADLAAAIYRASGDEYVRARRAVVHFAGLEAIGEREIPGDVGGAATQRMIQSLLHGTEILPVRENQAFYPLATQGMQIVFSAQCEGLADSIRRRQRGGHDIDAGQPLSAASRLSVSVDDLVRELKLTREFAQMLAVRALLMPPAPAHLRKQLREGRLWDLARFTSYIQHVMGVPLSLHESVADVLLAETEAAEGNVALCANVLARYLGTQPLADPAAHRRLEIDGETLAGARAPWLYPGSSELTPPSIPVDAPDSNEPAEPVFPYSSHWSAEEITGKLLTLRDRMGWQTCKDGPAGKFWRSIEEENKHQMGVVLKLASELWVVRKATIEEFHNAWIYSNCNQMQGVLHYLDYQRVKREEERQKSRGAASDGPAQGSAKPQAREPAAPAADAKPPQAQGVPAAAAGSAGPCSDAAAASGPCRQLPASAGPPGKGRRGKRRP